MPYVKTRDGADIYVKDWGEGRPVVLIHGWPLSADSWDSQAVALAEAGYRVIAYDRRGFGRSSQPWNGYDYNSLTDDLAEVMKAAGVEQDATLVGFSMGGGEVARYIARHGEERLRSVVFASSVTPRMMHLPDNPDGPLSAMKAGAMTLRLTADPDGFFDQFTRDYYSPNADGDVLVTEADRRRAIALCKQADRLAALEAMQSFGIADFRDDLAKISVRTLVIHGDADGIVPFEGSGARTHAAIPHSELVVLEGAPHGCNLTHAGAFNAALLRFLKT